MRPERQVDRLYLLLYTQPDRPTKDVVRSHQWQPLSAANMSGQLLQQYHLPR